MTWEVSPGKRHGGPGSGLGKRETNVTELATATGDIFTLVRPTGEPNLMCFKTV